MVGHDDVGLEIVMTQLLGRTVNRFDHQAGDLFALEPERPGAGGVQVTIDPDEGLPRAQVVPSRETGSRNAPVQVPGEKQRPTFRILMRKTPPLHWGVGEEFITAETRGARTLACRVATLGDMSSERTAVRISGTLRARPTDSPPTPLAVEPMSP